MMGKSNNLGRLLAVGAMAALVMAAQSAAAEPVERSGPADAEGTVEIENIAGSITIEGWDRAEIRVEGTLGKEVEELEFETGRKSMVKVVYPRRIKNITEGADLVIRVPQGSRVEVDCVSCPITVTGVKGKVIASSVSGDVTVTGSPRSVSAESISGDVSLDVDCPEVGAQSISGTVEVKGRVLKLEAETVSGDLDLRAERFLELRVSSVNGEADVAGDLDPNGSFNFDLHAGGLTLVLPASVSADIEVETFSGEIDTEFGGKARKVSQYAPGKELELVTGGGEARVRINTFSGDVRIKKR